MFIAPERFPFTAEISKKFEVLRDEYMRVAEKHVEPWHTKHTQYGWNGCPLMFSGYKKKSMWKQCVETAKAVENIPNLVSAGYWVLTRGTKLDAHVCLPKGIYRLHMGIIVPKNCEFTVAGETRPWEEGKWLVFEPTVLHEAWNNSDEDRVILLIDVWKDYAHREFGQKFVTWMDGRRFALTQTKPGRALVHKVDKIAPLRRTMIALGLGKDKDKAKAS